jgi:23S rRNA pseudouridine2604 synthase
MNVDRYIARSGFTSRRKAIVLIAEKRVNVNGKPATLKTLVGEGDTVSIDGTELESRAFVPTYIAYHKPKGIECTTEKIPNNIIDAINHPQTIYPVGRLDKDSEGLILLTNHAELINAIAHAEAGHEKEYIVTLNLPVRSAFLNEIAQGIDLMGERTKPCRVSREPNAKRIFRIVLTQGMNRQIRRMCNAFSYQVLRLQRVRVMHIALGKLKSGEWRDLTAEELEELLRQTGITAGVASP